MADLLRKVGHCFLVKMSVFHCPVRAPLILRDIHTLTGMGKVFKLHAGEVHSAA